MNLPTFNLATLSLLIAVVSGCRESTTLNDPPYAAGRVSTLSWAPSTANPLPGIDQAHLLSYWAPQSPADQHPVLLIWTDLYGAKIVATENTNGFEARANDILINFQFNSANTDDGTLVIAGSDYKTSKGAVFLVSTEREKPVVKQVDQSLTNLDVFAAEGSAMDLAKAKALARTATNILSFFRSRKPAGGP